jgi:ribosomal protein L37AE/L43A
MALKFELIPNKTEEKEVKFKKIKCRFCAFGFLAEIDKDKKIYQCDSCMKKFKAIEE